MRVETQTFKGSPRTLDALHRKIREHIKQHYHPPIGIVLGPKQYLAVMAEVSRQFRYTSAGYGLVYPDKFMGIPVSVKSKPGIDLLIDPQHVFRFCEPEKKK